jgi:Ca2+-binding EF-hand superfamily protein
LFIGATVEFNKFKFVLIDADEYNFNYMERHRNEFPRANIEYIMGKLKSICDSQQLDMNSLPQGVVPFSQFQEEINRLGQGHLSPHEIITVGRYYQEHKKEEVTFEQLLAMLQEQLRRANFEDFHLLQEQCQSYDFNRTGYLCLEEFRQVLVSLKAPVEDDMLRALVARMPLNEQGAVKYEELIRYMNWRDCAIQPLPTQYAQGNDLWQGNPRSPGDQLKMINIGLMIQDLTGRSSGQQNGTCDQ